MKTCGEYIVCHKDTCKIVEVKDNYYVLEPVNDKTLKMKVPVDSKILRDLIKKEDIEKLLKEIPSINTINSKDWMIENNYKELLQKGTYESLVSIIKTAYLRNEFRKNNNKKVSDRDSAYLEQVEKYLYTEIGTVLGLSYDEAKAYVIASVSKYNWFIEILMLR